MKNKTSILVAVSIFIFASPVFAGIPAPQQNLTVVVSTQGGENSFHFTVKTLWQECGETCQNVWNEYSQFDLQTQNLSAQKTVQPLLAYGYLITQDEIPGLKLQKIECVSDFVPDIFHPEIRDIFIPQGNGIEIYPAKSSESVICNFNNTAISDKTPVLIVPGLTGTELKDGDTLLWPDVPRMMNPLNSDNFMDILAFDENLNPTNTNLTTGSIVGSPIITQHFYDLLADEFIGQGYVEGETLFTFPYDWRYGVSGKYADGTTNADSLAQKIQDILQQTKSDKVDVVAHSLGGLIVKSYVINHPADNHIGKAVFVGVPNTGAPKAVKVLLQGDNLDVLGLNDQEIKKISQNMPAVYDLLPTRRYYDASFMSLVDIGNGVSSNRVEKDLNYDETKSFLIDGQKLNSTAYAGAEVLHSQSFDSYDLSKEGIDLYSINGCKSSTIAQMAEFKSGNTNLGFDILKITSGDGTVPFGSSDSIAVNGDNVFYAIDANHGKMPSQDGIRQKIVNLISSSQLDTGDNIITRAELAADNRKCQLEGWWARLFSPVSIEVIDQNGNRSGVALDGSIQNDIPGAGYEVMGEHKFVFVPTDENQNYTINLKGEGNGIFTFKNSQIINGQIIKTEVFSNLPVTSSLTGSVNINSADNTTSLAVKQTPTSQTQIILPSAIIDAASSEDLLPPVSKAILSGIAGQANFYRSDVSANIKATDNLSGVLNVGYNLDNAGYQKITGDNVSFKILKEGKHILTFFSTDKAGNNESEKRIDFEIRKTTRNYARP